MSFVALGSVIGRPIRCPDLDCGSTCRTEESRSGRSGPRGFPAPGNLPGQGVAGSPHLSRLWVLVHCPRTGAKLFPANTPVEVLGE